MLLLPYTHRTCTPLHRAVTHEHICDKVNSLLRLLVTEEVVGHLLCNPPFVMMPPNKVTLILWFQEEG